MSIFSKRSAPASTPLAMWVSGHMEAPVGYTRLIDSPNISACINRIAALIASVPIYQMENTEQGDKRVRDDLARRVDIDPVPGLMTRYSWMNWIVAQLLGDGDGNAYVLPEYDRYYMQLLSLRPMPGAAYTPLGDAGDLDYLITWHGKTYDRTEVIPFRLHADPARPSKGRGYRVQAQDVAKALATTDALKQSLSSPDYKPPLIVAVNSDADISQPEERERFVSRYLDKDGKPWVIPADLLKIEQVRPLSLADLAVKDTIDIDKRTACAIFGIPPFLLGLGAYNQQEYNNFIHNVVLPICVSIEQSLTQTLLPDQPKRYFKFARRRLYDYGLKELVDIDLAMSDRGYLNGDEVRDDVDLDPVGLTERRILENYIPWDMSGKQNKLNNKEE